MPVPTPEHLLAALGALADGVPLAGSGPDGPDPALRDDLLRIAYRLVLAELSAQASDERGSTRALRGLELERVDAADLSEATIARARGCLPSDEPGGAVSDEDLAALGALHEQVLAWHPVRESHRVQWRPRTGARRAAGAYFTPVPVVRHLVTQTLTPLLGRSADISDLRVVDPACGSGLFLLEVARQLSDALVAGGRSRAEASSTVVARCLHGVDRDPAAAELTRVSLWLWLHREQTREPSLGTEGSMPVLNVCAADAVVSLTPDLDATTRSALDALLSPSGRFDWGAAFPEVFARGGFDLVVGNPPFLNQLEVATASSRRDARALSLVHGPAVRPYTDLSAVFLLRSLSWLRDGGRVGLVQPLSLLATRDGGGVRRALAEAASLDALWVCEEPVFDASVPTCWVVAEKAGVQGPVIRSKGRTFETLASYHLEPDELAGTWGFLGGAALGLPEVRLPAGHGTVGDLAACTADFRDEYYGLAPFVRESSPSSEFPGRVAPLVTSGLVDPAQCLWGERPARFHKQTWHRPVVDLDLLEQNPALARWARSRLVPKLLVGTQGRVVEAFADPGGSLLPSVPVITVRPNDAGTLWKLLAILLAPPVSAHAAWTYAGTALTLRAVKLSAAQVGLLPLPAPSPHWEEAAREVELAQRAAAPELRDPHLSNMARLMCAAYEVDDAEVLLGWWTRRAFRRR